MDAVNNSAPTGGVVRRPRRRFAGAAKAVLLAAALLAANAAVSVLVVQWRTPEVVTFDMKGTVDRFMDQSSRRGLDEATSRALTDRFTANLNRSLEDWQASHRALIVVRPAVVSGARDITREVQQDVARRMQGQSE